MREGAAEVARPCVTVVRMAGHVRGTSYPAQLNSNLRSSNMNDISSDAHCDNISSALADSYTTKSGLS